MSEKVGRRGGRVVAGMMAAILPVGCMMARAETPQRPKITGISHVGYYVSDLPKAIAFWHDFLGYDEPYDLKRPGSATDVRIAFIKINDQQHVELFNEPPMVAHNMMSHLAFTVDNVEQMRAYLRAQGFDVPVGDGSKTRAGVYAFQINDPDGMPVEFVQSLPDGMEAKAKGKFMPETQASTHIYHLGFMVGNSQKSMDFYGRVLGFRETWRGGPDPKVLSWINMQVPDGKDYVEFMLYGAMPPTDQWGGRNHIALEVPDIAKATAVLKARAAKVGYGKDMTVKVGVNGKRQMNMYDPDGTRVELMEPFTANGKVVPPSTALPPMPVKN